jgi:hypothetical protein
MVIEMSNFIIKRRQYMTDEHKRSACHCPYSVMTITMKSVNDYKAKRRIKGDTREKRASCQ